MYNYHYKNIGQVPGSTGGLSDTTNEEDLNRLEREIIDTGRQREEPGANSNTLKEGEYAITNPWKYFLILGGFIFGAFIAKMTKKR